MFGLLKTLLLTAALRQSADGAKRRLRRAVVCAAVAIGGGLVILVGTAFLIAFGHEALALATDSQTANLAFGAGLIAVGALAIAISKTSGKRRQDKMPSVQATGAAGGDLGRDIEGLLSRNAGALATGAFVAGLLLATRRR